MNGITITPTAQRNDLLHTALRIATWNIEQEFLDGLLIEREREQQMSITETAYNVAIADTNSTEIPSLPASYDLVAKHAPTLKAGDLVQVSWKDRRLQVTDVHIIDQGRQVAIGYITAPKVGGAFCVMLNDFLITHEA